MDLTRSFKTFLSYFDPAEHAAPIQDPDKVDKLYKYWRLRTFYSMYMGYAFYYFTRKSFNAVMPVLKEDLGFRSDEIGALSSIFAITYGISKFTSGMLADRSNPRFFMAFGLIMTGLWNLCFGFSSYFWMFMVFWGLNGWFQGFGWPGCARLLTHWYSQSERGRWWGFWNTSHNVGGGLSTLILGAVAGYFGWRYGMYLPGVLCIFGGFILMNRLRDTPQSLGLPTIEVYREEHPITSKKPIHQPERELTSREILFKHVLSNPLIWFLGLSYFFVYVVRTAVNDWSMLFLVEQKGYSNIGASQVVFWFEVGGFFGSLVSGWCSDTIFKGRRGPVIFIFMVFTAITTLLFAHAPLNSFLWDSSMMFLSGFFIFGPQMLTGIAAAELSHKKAAATATGFTGTIAYLGAAAAGYPLGLVLQQYGWDQYFIALLICSFASIAIMAPFWKIRSKPVHD